MSDDMDDMDFDDDADFEDFEDGSGTLGDMWRNNPLVKVGVIFGGLIAVIAVVILFGGGNEGPDRSVIRTKSNVAEAPGTGDELSPAMEAAIKEDDARRIEEAKRKGDSALPTPINPGVDRITLPEDPGEEAEDPLERWRKIQEERQKIEATKKPDLPEQDPHADTIDALANAMSAQMESILGTLTPQEPFYKAVTPVDFLEEKDDGSGGGDGDGSGGGDDGDSDEPAVVNILLPAGTIEYAQLITEANSDAPGPILAQVVSGPLAGARMIGDFSVEENYLVLNFSTIVIDGVAHSTSAIALDPKRVGPGLVTEIDRRYFKRVILPAAASFVEGLGSAIAESGSTSVSVEGGAAVESKEDLDLKQEVFKGVEEAASKVGELLDEEAGKTKPLIRVDSGTPMGILFVDPVTEETK